MLNGSSIKNKSINYTQIMDGGILDLNEIEN